jgi:hypothetical protein
MRVRRGGVPVILQVSFPVDRAVMVMRGRSRMRLLQTSIVAQEAGAHLILKAISGCIAAGVALSPSAHGRDHSAQPATPIALHAVNPHYFQWRGRPTILIASGEHYGAVMNLDFDYRRYLDTLAADGLNYTRIFSGAYVEPLGAFKIERNTLAPAAGRFISPWPRSTTPGYANGGNKFDLSRWDDGYFKRLQEFVAYASSKGVVVELSLFCPMYEDMQWRLSPMNAGNNVNGVGKIARTDVYATNRNGGLQAIQETLTRKLVTELNAFDNVFFEICNEPYFGGVTMAWQHRIADVIVETERTLPARHLIAQNIANESAQISDPHPAVSIFNFHYANPPYAVAMNHGLGKVIGDDETGFRGTSDAAYRTEAWEFVLAGGGLYNNLDYSFVAGQEDGTFAFPSTQPGGGGVTFRAQMKTLRAFIDGFDFIQMRPDISAIKGGVPLAARVQALVEPGRSMAVYVRRRAAAGGEPADASLQIELPDGQWQGTWVNPATGTMSPSVVVAGGGIRAIASPPFEIDVALRLIRQ